MSPEELDTYARNRAKQILVASDGKKAFGEINSDPSITPDEKQRVCCAIAKALVEVECNRAMKENPNTLLRQNTGPGTFLSAYMGHHAKGYFDAVAKSSIEANTHSVRNNKKEVVSRTPPNDHESAKKMLEAYTTELPKLSKEAAQFLKVTVDVIKDKMPEHVDTAVPIVMSSTLVLRGGAPKVTVGWQMQEFNKVALNEQTAINSKVRDLTQYIDNAERQVKTNNEKIETLTESLSSIEDQKLLEETKLEIEKLKETNKSLVETIDKDKIELKNLKKTQLEVTQKHKDQMLEYETGKEAATSVMELANKPESGVGEFKREGSNKLAAETELVKEFNATMVNLGNGKVSQHVELSKLPEVGDLDKLAVEVKQEQAMNKQLREKAQVQPDLDKLAKLQSDRQKMEEPSIGTRFKALFKKGGLEAMKKELDTKIEMTKLDIVAKVDKDQLNLRTDQQQQELTTAQNLVQSNRLGALAYLQAKQEFEQQGRQVGIEGADPNGVIGDQLDEMKSKLGNAKLEMEMNEEAYNTWKASSQEVDRLQKVVTHGEKLGASPLTPPTPGTNQPKQDQTELVGEELLNVRDTGDVKVDTGVKTELTTPPTKLDLGGTDELTELLKEVELDKDLQISKSVREDSKIDLTQKNTLTNRTTVSLKN